MDFASSLVAPAPDSPYVARSGGLAPAHLQRALDTIDSQPGRALSVNDLAASLPMSPFHFSRAFRISMGVPPHRYMLTQRIERSKAFLLATDMPIAEIASATGFKTASHFTSVFRRVVNMTPGKYRAAARGTP